MPQIAADLDYTPPSFNAFDRLTDIDTPMRSYQDLGGASLNVDWKLGHGTADVDHGLALLGLEAVERPRLHRPADHDRSRPRRRTRRSGRRKCATPATLPPSLNVVAGGFFFHQALDSDPSFKQEQGSAAARFLLAPSANAATPGLLDGYGFDQFLRFRNTSAAVFGQLEWSVTDRLRLLPGLRFNYDQKDVDFDQQVYGGLQTTDPGARSRCSARCSRRRPTRPTSTTPTCPGR